MAGPGFDLLVYLFAIAGGAVIMLRNISDARKIRFVSAQKWVNIVGGLTMISVTVYVLCN
jgi:hypothetical protein